MTKERLFAALDRRLDIYLWQSLLRPFHSWRMKSQAKRIRVSERIKVLFVVQEMNAWNTRELYDVMVRHQRFFPVIGVASINTIPERKTQLESWLKSARYEYVDLDAVSISKISPDIIFYQKPYLSAIPRSIRYWHYPDILVCHVHYAFHQFLEDWELNQPLRLWAWQVYMECRDTADECSNYCKNHGRNYVVTGLPIQDGLIRLSQANLKNPWRDTKGRKRVIYAPHHTICDEHWKGIGFSTFLEYCETMLKLAEEYSSAVYFVFKPHPLLYRKLLKLWGTGKAQDYYCRWAELENGQVETGTYQELFAFSDAMIHDCSSFSIEYLYTGKPVLYLVRDGHHADSLGKIAREAFNMHYKANSKDDIIRFLSNVINDVDPMKHDRIQFCQQHLIPPFGRTACDNIIDAILGTANL